MITLNHSTSGSGLNTGFFSGGGKKICVQTMVVGGGGENTSAPPVCNPAPPSYVAVLW